MEIEKETMWAWEKDKYKQNLLDTIENFIIVIVKSSFEDIKSKNYTEDFDTINSFVDLLDYILTETLYWVLKSVIFTGLTADYTDNEDALKHFNKYKTKYEADINRDRELIKKGVIFELANRLSLK